MVQFSLVHVALSWRGLVELQGAHEQAQQGCDDNEHYKQCSFCNVTLTSSHIYAFKVRLCRHWAHLCMCRRGLVESQHTHQRSQQGRMHCDV